MEVGPRMYFLVSGLLYPAALGAALVWTVSALHARVFLESASKCWLNISYLGAASWKSVPACTFSFQGCFTRQR
ncbi:hypothetical protein ED857_19910, partial [Acinetobacter baumannii]